MLHKSVSKMLLSTRLLALFPSILLLQSSCHAFPADPGTHHIEQAQHASTSSNSHQVDNASHTPRDFNLNMPPPDENRQQDITSHSGSPLPAQQRQQGRSGRPWSHPPITPGRVIPRTPVEFKPIAKPKPLPEQPFNYSVTDSETGITKAEISDPLKKPEVDLKRKERVAQGLLDPIEYKRMTENDALLRKVQGTLKRGNMGIVSDPDGKTIGHDSSLSTEDVLRLHREGWVDGVKVTDGKYSLHSSLQSQDHQAENIDNHREEMEYQERARLVRNKNRSYDPVLKEWHPYKTINFNHESHRKGMTPPPSPPSSPEQAYTPATTLNPFPKIHQWGEVRRKDKGKAIATDSTDSKGVHPNLYGQTPSTARSARGRLHRANAFKMPDHAGNQADSFKGKKIATSLQPTTLKSPTGATDYQRFRRGNRRPLKLEDRDIIMRMVEQDGKSVRTAAARLRRMPESELRARRGGGIHFRDPEATRAEYLHYRRKAAQNARKDKGKAKQVPMRMHENSSSSE